MVCHLIFVLTSVGVNNHTSVYGSYFRDGKWGYACCHQFHKNSYCTGVAGIEADEAAARLARGEIDDVAPPPPRKKERTTAADMMDTEKIRDAVRGATKRRRPENDGLQLGKRELSAAELSMISEKEYEDYRRNKMSRTDDPLHAMKDLEGTL
jgi:pre-mRNA-processing factor SLU7